MATGYRFFVFKGKDGQWYCDEPEERGCNDTGEDPKRRGSHLQSLGTAGGITMTAIP